METTQAYTYGRSARDSDNATREGLCYGIEAQQTMIRKAKAFALAFFSAVLFCRNGPEPVR